jgi:UDP-glucuronate 4-epimerase
MKSALVTGGAGFIGSNLCEKLLSLGYKVINIDNFSDYYNPCIKRVNISNSLTNPNYVLVQGDIRDRELLDVVFSKYEVETVIHLAALPGVRKSIECPWEYMDVDITGTVNILEACRKYKISKLIFASSSSVYGNNKMPFVEEDVVNSQMSPYAMAKAAGELLCRTYHNLYQLSIVCLRFFTVYGPRQRPEMAIHKFTNLIDEGKEITIYGDGTNARDFTYIDDIVEGIVASMNIKVGFEIFNLGNSNMININDLIYIIEKNLKKTANKNYISLQSGDVMNTCSNISKSKAMLDYSPSTSIEEGVALFVIWYNSYKNIYRMKNIKE